MAGDIKPDGSEPQPEQGGIVSDVKDAALQAARHVESLAELLHIELQEYARFQVRRAVFVALGAVMLLIAYGLLCILAIDVLQRMAYMDERLSIVAVVAFNAILGLLLLCIGILRKPEGVAPATGQEIKNDIQCIKLYLQGKGKS